MIVTLPIENIINTTQYKLVFSFATKTKAKTEHLNDGKLLVPR